MRKRVLLWRPVSSVAGLAGLAYFSRGIDGLEGQAE